MGPQEMLDRAEVKNKWQLTPLKDLITPSDGTHVADSGGCSADFPDL